MTEVTIDTPNAHVIVPNGTTINKINALSVSQNSLEILGTVKEIVVKTNKAIRIFGEGLKDIKISNGLESGNVKVILSEEGTDETAIEKDKPIEIDESGNVKESEAPKSNDTSISEVKVAEVEATVDTQDATKYTVTVPYGIVLTAESLTLNLAAEATKEVTFGNNVYTVVVTAEDGTTTETYTITVTIAEPPAPTTYTVTFEVTPKDAIVEVKDGQNLIQTQEDGTYKLETGTYTYGVSAEGYVTQTKKFTVSEEAQTITVDLVLDETTATALVAVNDYFTSEKYVYANAPTVLEPELTKLGIDVGNDSQYASLDKTAADGKNRKTAVFYDLNNNKPDGGYDLTTLKTYFNQMVDTRLATQASMDLVNDAETLQNIEYVTMLLERFKTVNYKKHSDDFVQDKVSTLECLVNSYNALDEDTKEAVLRRVIELRNSQYGGQFARSQFTTDALDTALKEVVTEKNDRLSITSVSIVDNKAYASTAAGEGKTVRVLGYGIGINISANSDGKKISDTTSIVVELYNEETLLGKQTFNAIGYTKHADKSATSGTIDAGGNYVSTSWNNEWYKGISDIPTKAVAKVQYTDGIATAEYTVNLTNTQVFEAAEAVYALFVDPFVETLVLKDDVTQESITQAEAKVGAINNTSSSSHKVLFTEMLTKANELLNPTQP